MVFQDDNGQAVVEHVLRDLPAARVHGLAVSGPKANEKDEDTNERGKESRYLPPGNHGGHSCERRTGLQGEGRTA